MFTRSGFVINQETLACNFKKQTSVVTRFYETVNKKDAVKSAKFFAGRFLVLVENTVHTQDSVRCPANVFYHWWTDNETVKIHLKGIFPVSTGDFTVLRMMAYSFVSNAANHYYQIMR